MEDGSALCLMTKGFEVRHRASRKHNGGIMLVPHDTHSREYFSQSGGIPHCKDCESYEEFPASNTGVCLYLTDMVLQTFGMDSEVRVKATQDASECNGFEHYDRACEPDYDDLNAA
jgi:hypothetical protein